MFARISLLALPLLATASILPRGGGEGVACATGTVHQLTGSVGVSCVPITVIGVGGTQCSNQVDCCTDNNFVSNGNGLVSLGCSPLNIGL
ncbi:hydrophobin [Armillaria borealis]|uniref:Hydrophobin n=1 Tax=Armillaria borealis TaxID=47425 RepID=A0AA39MHW6_9AGAR|nr:hydrophobin [Armillaria borealis]